MRYFILLNGFIFVLFLTGCAAKTAFRESCAVEVNAAWKEIDAAKAKGLSGTVSYTKALGMISLAKSMQAVENFDNCVRHAKKAKFYAGQSNEGS